MTSQQSPSALAQAPALGREVLNFYYILDPEERIQLGWRAHALVQRVAASTPDIVFFLDKSGRPLQHLFRKAWRYSQDEGEVTVEQFPQQVGFLHIGRDRDRGFRHLLASKDLPQLADYYCRKLRRVPRRVLIVDEILGSGQTMKLAYKVVSAMFPGVEVGAFFFQDSQGTTELFVKPNGDRQATWKMGLDDNMAYGLQGVSDVCCEIRKEYPDILAYRPALRRDWEEQLWAMEGECAVGFAISLRMMSNHVDKTLDGIGALLATYPKSVFAQRGIYYASRIRKALENGLPHISLPSEKWVPAHETVPEVRKVTRDQITWLRVAACYWNKLTCMLDAVGVWSNETEAPVADLHLSLDLQGKLLRDLAHWASEWEASRLFDQHGPVALQYEIGRLRNELTESVTLYWRYRQHNRGVLG